MIADSKWRHNVTRMSTAPRRTYTLEFKLSVLEWMKTNRESTRGTARRFGIHRRMVQKWKESESKMAQAFTTNGAHRKKIHQAEQPLYQKLEENMLNWFISQEKEALCDKNIKTRALLIAKDIGLENFKGSSGWVSSFRQRHSIFKDNSEVNGDKNIISITTHLSANAFLTCTNPNDAVKLDFINEGVETHQPIPTEDKIVYYDYQTPEHNYCRPVTMAMSVQTTRLLDRSVCNPWDDAMLWSGIFDQQVLYM